MICRCGRSGFQSISDLEAHWKTEGCNRGRAVWKRVVRARRNGTSGKRILHKAFPGTYKVEPMPQELKDRWKKKDE